MARLFDMSEAELDRAVEAHYDRMLDEYEREQEMMCCKYCKHYDGEHCEKLIDELSEEDFEAMEYTHDWTAVKKDEDDYCDDFKMREE
jgi:hypothetical protein